MAKFVKLTGAGFGEPIYVNPDQVQTVEGIDALTEENKNRLLEEYPKAKTLVSLANKHGSIVVVETPEEAISKIEAL